MRLLKVVSVCVVPLLLIACSSSGDAPAKPFEATVSVASILIAPETLSLPVGGTITLSAQLRDANSNSLSGRVVSWTSDSPAIVAVTSGGVLTALAVGANVHVTATVESKSAVATISVKPPADATIGAQGGTLMAPLSGATMSFSAGAVTGALPVQVRDSATAEPRYATLSANALAVVLPLTGTSAAFQQSGNVQLSIPITRDIAPGSTGYVRARFNGIDGEFWAPATSVDGKRLTLSMPSRDFEEFKTVLGLETLDVVFDVEEVPGIAAGALRVPFSTVNTVSSAAKLGASCPALPANIDLKLYAPCDDARIMRIVAPGNGRFKRLGILLVHGWTSSLVNGADYLQAQGLCQRLLPILPCTWAAPPTPVAGRALPAYAYFTNLRSVLEPDLAGFFDGAPLYVFDYQSYNDYSTSAFQLRQKLLENTDVDGFIIVAHSMGGLVSRQAAALLEVSGNTQKIRGIITLATPHSGSPLPVWQIGVFASGILTPGAQSLLPASALPRNEHVPLVLYAGDIDGDALHRGVYTLGWNAMCLRSALCSNDGVVPLASAQPATFLAKKDVAFRDVLPGYDHSQMKLESGANGDRRGLAPGIEGDLFDLLFRAGATDLRIGSQPTSATVGATISPVTVTLTDGSNKIISAPSYRVAVSLGKNPGGAQLRGTLSVNTDSRGVATFPDLSLDKPGNGYSLVVSAANLSTTSAPFDVTAPAQVATIVAAPSSVSFNTTVGGSLAAAKTVAISNGGAGTLTGLVRGAITYGSAEPGGWLGTATLSGTTGNANLTLQPINASLPVGTYHATVLISATGNVSNSPFDIDVTYVITGATTLAAPIQLGPSNGATNVSVTPTFSWSAVTGANRYWLMIATDPNAFPVGLSASSCSQCVMSGFTNTNSHSLPNAFPNGSDGAVAGKLLNGVTYYWRVQAFNNTPNPNTVGLYSPSSGFTTISATSNSSVIALSRQSISLAAIRGGANPSNELVFVSNSGSGALSGLSAAVSFQSGQAGGWLSASLSSSTAPATLTISSAVGSLAIGTYNATIAIISTANGVANSPQIVAVTCNVTSMGTPPTIVLSNTATTFSANSGGNNPAQQTVQITNGGTSVLAGLAANVSYQNGQPSGWLSASLNTTSAPATLAISTTLGSLPAGTYNATVAVSSSSQGVINSPQVISVTLTVSGSNQVQVLASGLGGIFGLTRNGNTLTFTDYYGGGVFRISTDGSGLIKLATVPITGPTGVVNDGTDVYWLQVDAGGSSPGVIHKVPISGGAVTTVATSLPGAGANLQSDGTNLYFYSFSTGTIKRIPKSGGTAVDVVQASPEQQAAFTISGGFIYFLDAQRIKRVSTAGGAVTTLTSGATSALDLLVVGSTLYWVNPYSPGCCTLGLFSVPISATSVAPTARASGVSFANLASDGVSLYASGSGGVTRYNLLNFSDVATISTTGGSTGFGFSLVVDGQSVYWTGNGVLLKTQK